MCGICGFFSKKTITTEQLKAMNDTMYHRGPNDSGEEIYPAKDGYTVGLAQRRLSILDLWAPPTFCFALPICPIFPAWFPFAVLIS